MKFGDNLKSYREQEHLTQDELAKILGISRSAICMYERGEREPNFEMACKLSNYFGVRVDELFGGVTKEPTSEEKTLLRLFGNADPFIQKIVVDILRANQKER